MSNKMNPLIIIMVLLTALLCFTNISMAADPVELENLRDSFTIAKQSVINEDQRKEVINNYIDSLTDLATDLRIYKHDLAGANMVRKEIRKAKKELDADPADRVEPRRQVIATPEPKPVVAATIPKPEPMPAPAPQQVAAKPTPKPVMPIPAPKPAETKPKPKPIAKTKPAPKPVIATPVPKLFIPVPVPKPVIAKLKLKSVVAKPKPKPVVAKSKPKTIAKKKPAPKPVVAKPTPKPVAAPVVNPAPKKEHTPQTHVNSVQGLAGGDGSSKNNVYTFNLPGIGSSTTLAFWATGRNSVETYGKVWLITPENRRIFIRIWKESYFDYPSTEIATYYKLRPITEDITKKVTKPGIYKVEFEWTEGKDPLVIYRVEITS